MPKPPVIRRIAHIARREWLEQTRQPIMLATIASLYLLIAGLVLFILGMLQLAHNSADASALIQQSGAGLGLDEGSALETFARITISAYTFLVFTQYLGFGAVLCGHAVLHDRQTHTLPFLLLAPISRFDLLAGKLLGALGGEWRNYQALRPVYQLATEAGSSHWVEAGVAEWPGPAAGEQPVEDALIVGPPLVSWQVERCIRPPIAEADTCVG